MKEKLVNNQSLKLISVAFAFVIWIAVVNVSNPEVTRSKTVPLTVIHGEVLTTAGKTYTVQNGESVTVSYQVRARDAYRIDADNFKATIDLENLYDVTGSVPVSVEVVGNRDLINASPVARPGVIRVLTEDIQNKSFPLTTHPVGEPAENFEVGSMTLKPETVMVSGPVSEVGRISSVGVKVNVSGASEDLSGTAPVTYFDANGNEIQREDDRMKSEPGDISYYVDMLRGKSLPLRLNVGGEAAQGYRFTGTECSVKSVSVVGEPGLLEGLREIAVPDTVLNVGGANADKSVTVDLNQFLPPGASVNGSPMVTVTMKVEAVNTMAYQVSLARGIELKNRREDYRYKLMPTVISVELSALPETLRSITANDLHAYVDVAGREPGTGEGTLNLTTPEGTELVSVTPFLVSVSTETEGSASETRSETAGTAWNSQTGESSGENEDASAASGGASGESTFNRTVPNESAPHESAPHESAAETHT